MERTSVRATCQRARPSPPSRIVARSRLVVATFLLHGCTSSSPALDLIGPATIRNDGTAARYQAVATTASGAPGEGVVVVTSTAGTVEAGQMLSEGVLSFELRCAGCEAPLTLTATWNGVEATRRINTQRPEPAAGPVDAGRGTIEGPTDSGMPGSGRRDLPPTFSCGGWDGGAREGYTTPDGGPLAIGCDGERIDAVFIEFDSPTKISICGTVEFTEPMPDPVFARAQLSGAIRFQGPTRFCCGELRCLEDPKRLKYRFDLEPSGFVLFGAGARTYDYSATRFGFFDGVGTMPAAEDQAVPIELDAGTRRNVDFVVGLGKRRGDP
jgi:hypothetical protein